MELKEWLKTPFQFAAIPVSVLAVLIYGSVFTAVSITDQTPAVPKDLGGLNLSQAYENLHIITARPHPYISHTNDEVREFLLDRLKPIVASREYVKLSDDMVSNASYVTSRGAVYFEGTNILLKIEGTDAPSLDHGAVLFSAHYDSVSTAPGATDNAMGVVTLLSMVEYLSDPKRRPRRSAIFLFNNGEEDGLNGAHAFFEHPWSNLTSSFINVEGAAAGGRPILVRSTSLSAAKSFRSKSIRHPHGSVIIADAFARGVVRSATDFEVFARGIKGETPGLSGIDFAFYKNRAYYHTPLDSVPGMGFHEGRRSLWAMMESVRGAGLAMLNGDEAVDNDDAGVYFDVLGRIMVAFPLRTLFVAHIVLLTLGPLVVFGLMAWVVVLSIKNTVAGSEERQPPRTTGSRSRHHLVATVFSWAKFWLASLIAISLNVALVAGYLGFNPFIVYSRPYLVLTTFLAISFLSITFSFSLGDSFRPSPPSSLKSAAILELYGLSWVFLVMATVAVNNLHVGGVYLITTWNFCAWIAALIVVAEAAVRAGRDGEAGGKAAFDLVGENELPAGETADHRFVRGVMYQSPERDEDDGAANGQQEGEEVETDPTEITPLMQQHRRQSSGGREYIIGIDGQPLLVNGIRNGDAGYQDLGWWILQMLVLIPLPVTLLFQITLVLLHSLRNTMADGSSPLTIYAGLAALSVFIFVNLTPFAHRIHHSLNLFIMVVVVLTLAMTWTAFPFTQEAPLKVFFQQRLQLDLAPTLPSSHQEGGWSYFSPARLLSTNMPDKRTELSVLSSETLLTGIRGYVDNLIIPELPSSWGKSQHCEIDTKLRPGLLTCGWENGLLPSPGGNASRPATSSESRVWLALKTERLNVSTARISIKGTNTRGCRLLFDSPIQHFHVHGSRDGLQPGYEVPEEGVKDLMLWSRNWNNEFVVDFSWHLQEETFRVEGRAACEWAEYASATAGSPYATVGGQIPALEEVINFLPLWAIPTKWTTGLVEASVKFLV